MIVFKFPGNAAVNYIKRLIGLPGEKLWIVGGNIYTCGKDEPDDELRIARKPPAKLDALLQIVDDTGSHSAGADEARLAQPLAESGRPAERIRQGSGKFWTAGGRSSPGRQAKTKPGFGIGIWCRRMRIGRRSRNDTSCRRMWRSGRAS